MKYVLVTIAAGVLLAIVIDSWFVKGQAPSKVLIGAVLILALTPLASRIKIFDFIDFRKSVDRLDGELTETRKEIATVSTNLQNLQLGISTANNARQDQVITLNLGDSMMPSTIQQRSDVVSEEVLENEGDQSPFVLSPAFRIRWYLLEKLTVAIGQITTALFTLSAFVEAQKIDPLKGPPTASKAMDLTLTDLVLYFRENRDLNPMRQVHPHSLLDDDLNYLQRLEDLDAKTTALSNGLTMMLRDKDQLLDQSNQGLDTEIVRGLIVEAETLKAYFMGSAFGISAASGAWLVTAAKLTEES